jgi:hypothetical protein
VDHITAEQDTQCEDKDDTVEDLKLTLLGLSPCVRLFVESLVAETPQIGVGGRLDRQPEFYGEQIQEQSGSQSLYPTKTFTTTARGGTGFFS